MSSTQREQDVIQGFGEEWSRFDQTGLSDQERLETFASYFEVFPWDALPGAAVGFDLGCGSGRWAALVAPRVGHLHCVDPSDALDVARRTLEGVDNTTFHRATAHTLPFDDGSMDFGYSLGVLHHIEDTEGGLRAAVRALKPGAPFLLYLYYALDNRPRWFRALWRASDLGRRVVARQPARLRQATCDAIALGVYWPLARGARVGERLGARVDGWPLSAYRDRTVYAMRTDALDRFGTRLEKRYTRVEMEQMMRRAGLDRIQFCSGAYWTAVGYRAT